MRNPQTKTLPCELKQVGEEGSFEGIAAVYGIRDDVGDIIEKGAFARTLRHRKNKVPLLWQHNIQDPIGFGELTDADGGLEIKGKLNLEIRRAKELHALMKQAKAEGVPFGLSIGYDTLQSDWQGSTRYLKEVRLWEVSPTLFPAQSRALVNSIKDGMSEGKPFGEFEDFEACIAANQDKDDPEGFCAFLHQQITGDWPSASASWKPRVDALFVRIPEIRITRKDMEEFCPSCAEKMAERKMAVLRISPKSIKQMPEELLQGLCDKYGGDEGFFTRCTDDPPSEIDDPESFCAWLHEQCTGSFPGEGRSRVAGIRYGLSELGKALDALPSRAEAMTTALARIREAKDALTALLEANPDLSLAKDPAEAALWRLVREMHREAQRKVPV